MNEYATYRRRLRRRALLRAIAAWGGIFLTAVVLFLAIVGVVVLFGR